MTKWWDITIGAYEGATLRVSADSREEAIRLVKGQLVSVIRVTEVKRHKESPGIIVRSTDGVYLGAVGEYESGGWFAMGVTNGWSGAGLRGVYTSHETKEQAVEELLNGRKDV